MFFQHLSKLSNNKAQIRLVFTIATQNARRRANPGVESQSKLFKTEGVTQDIEEFDELESDFMEVHKSHKQFEQESEELRERTRHWVVKNKYFKQKLPNFLTFAEKEQVKLLNNRDPEEWTTEKLAECFPATVDIIKKIIRAKWMPRSLERIRKHDESVMNNWNKLNNNGFPELTESTTEHLKKFAVRKKEDLIQNNAIPPDWTPRIELPKPTTTEFLSIITSCKQYENASETRKVNPSSLQLSTGKQNTNNLKLGNETFLAEKVMDKRYMRLKELDIFKLSAKDSTSTILVQDSSKNKNTNINNPFNSKGITLNKLPIAQTADDNISQQFKTNEVIVSEYDRKKYEMTTVKDQIYIPKKLWRKGATFKVEDCYYDDDGSFLYRVPGMTGFGK